MTQHFLYKLLPPRPDFAFTMTPEEAAVMAEHARYWSGLLEGGSVVVYGPVAEPAGAWACGACVRVFSVAVHRVDASEAAPLVRDGDAR